MYAYVLIGKPCVGKSFWRRNLTKFQSQKNWQVASLDDIIVQIAERKKMEPRAVWERDLPKARQSMEHQLKMAVAQGRPVVFDVHTAATKAGRDDLLKLIPDSYQKIAIVFADPPDHETRLKKRVFEHPVVAVEVPTESEGYSEIRHVTI